MRKLFDAVKKVGKFFTSDVKRCLILLILAVVVTIIAEPLALETDRPYLALLIINISVTTAIVMGGYIIRRIVIPKVDYQKYCGKAFEHPIGAAIVVFSITLFTCTLLTVQAYLYGK